MKLTDCHQYLHFTSAHLNHTKRSVVVSQNLRISRLGSNESDFDWNKEKMRSRFVKREYPEKLIDSEIRTVKFKGATKLYFMNYFCVVIFLLITDLYKSAFSTCSFKKTLSFLFVFCVFCLICFKSNFIDFLWQFCNYYLYMHQVLCDFFSHLM